MEAKKEMIKIHKELGIKHWSEFYCKAPFQITEARNLKAILFNLMPSIGSING